MRGAVLSVLSSVFVLAGCAGGGGGTGAGTGPAGVDGKRIAAADSEPGNWLTHGRTYDEQRFSPLKQIDATNVGRLGLAWFWDTGRDRGHESTPIVVDGKLFVTASWSVVHALDAKTGEHLWSYDPQVPGEWARFLCCDVVNRGVAVWKGKVYVGTLDGRLVALDAETGAPVWDVRTTPEDKPYSITAAPRVVKGKVIIGNGGAEFGVRGYVSAYDAESGELVWRFYTVPGDPSQPFENEALEKAVKTWTGEWWEVGGGGTVWDSVAFDPDLDLLYVGTGNGSPWTRHYRSPGGGDNLYLSSILALDPDDGHLVWYYQTTPGDNWDYTATQHIVLADLEWEGEPRKVLMQAPKNGFFYVLDRQTGELLSAEPFIQGLNWASHVDMETGRPVETGLAVYDDAPKVVQPSYNGGHNWHPMSYDPETGLVYLPTLEIAAVYPLAPDFEYDARTWNLGLDVVASVQATLEMPLPPPSGRLQAWNPLTQEAAWAVPQPASFNGGVLSTAGNLVFQGTGDGRFVAYAADSGEQLWQVETGIGIVAPPVTYTVDGEQYVAVLAGWGGNVIAGFDLGLAAAFRNENPGRLFVFRLDGDAPMPEVRPKLLDIPEPPAIDATPEQIAQGNLLYHSHCSFCHGFLVMSSGATPDLRRMSSRVWDRWDDVILEGALHKKGMAGYSDILDVADAAAIKGFVASRAREDRAAAAAESSSGAE